MENRYWRYIAWVCAAIIFISIGYGIGFSKGFAQGVSFAVRVGLDFVEINIDEEKMIKLVNIYQTYCRTDGVAECLDNFRIGENITL